MSEWGEIRERYLQDGVDIRLGGLAANLARIGSFSRRPEHSDAVSRLIRESALFIEWTAADAPAESLGELAELQRVLSNWYQRWSDVWADASQRADVGEVAAQWSARVLALSGLGSLSDREDR
jgi:hypothetical protein